VPVPENVNHRTVVARVPRTCQTGTEFGHSRLTRGHDFFVYKKSDLVADPLGASSKLVMLVRFSPMIAVPGQGRPQSRARDAAPDREGKTGARLPTYVRLVIRRSVLSPEPEAPVGLGCLSCSSRLRHSEASVSSPRDHVELVKPQMRLERMVEIQHRGTASSGKLLQE
jgi:hypothetical protein